MGIVLLGLCLAGPPALAQTRRKAATAQTNKKKTTSRTAAGKNARRAEEPRRRRGTTAELSKRRRGGEGGDQTAKRDRKTKNELGAAPNRRRLSSADLAKSKAELEQEKRENERRAREANRILAQTRARKEASLGQLNALKEKITVQQTVIKTISSEVNYLDHDVHRTEENVGDLRLDLADLKAEYARTVYEASKSARATDKLMFLFAAESFNQFAMRLRYLRQYTAARRQQAAQIAATQQRLEEQLHSLTRKRQTKQQLLGAQLAENQSLLSLKTEQDEVVQQLSQQEEQLKREVAERQAAVSRLDALIAQKVREEIARAAREARLAEARRVAAARREAAARANAERRTSEATREEVRAAEKAEKEAAEAEEEAAATETTAADRRATRLALTPEATALAASFAGNKGRLPWPVARGFVSQHFGRHPHPVLKHVVVENRGIDIQTGEGEMARAIFDGKVLTVTSVPGMNTIVMVQHGDFFTVYAKLRDVKVSAGQRVRVNDPIGRVFTSPEGTTELQFQIWRNSRDLNPEAWLGRR